MVQPELLALAEPPAAASPPEHQVRPRLAREGGPLVDVLRAAHEDAELVDVRVQRGLPCELDALRARQQARAEAAPKGGVLNRALDLPEYFGRQTDFGL